MGEQEAEDADLLEVWTHRLENLTVSPLTRDYPESGRDVTKVPVDAFESSSSTENALQKFDGLSDHSTIPFNILQTAFIVLVSRLTGDEDISIGTNATQDGTAFVLRSAIAPSESFSDLLKKTSNVSTEVVRVEPH